MFQNSYQNGNIVEIFNSRTFKDSGKSYEKLFKITGGKKIFDKEMKTYVLDFETSKGKMMFPQDEKAELGLVQHYIVFHIYFYPATAVSIDLNLTDLEKVKRRLNLCSAYKEIEPNMFHVKIPITESNIPKGKWILLCIDHLSFMELFKGKTFRSLDGFGISSKFKLFKIYTSRESIPIYDDSGSNYFLDLKAIKQVMSKSESPHVIQLSVDMQSSSTLKDASNRLTPGIDKKKTNPNFASKCSTTTPNTLRKGKLLAETKSKIPEEGKNDLDLQVVPEPQQRKVLPQKKPAKPENNSIKIQPQKILNPNSEKKKSISKITNAKSSSGNPWKSKIDTEKTKLKTKESNVPETHESPEEEEEEEFLMKTQKFSTNSNFYESTEPRANSPFLSGKEKLPIKFEDDAIEEIEEMVGLENAKESKANLGHLRYEDDNDNDEDYDIDNINSSEKKINNQPEEAKLDNLIEKKKIVNEEMLGKTFENWSKDIMFRPSSPPYVNVLELNSPGQTTYTIANMEQVKIEDSKLAEKNKNMLKDAENPSNNDLMEVIYDPILNCYYDPKSNSYYQLKE